MADDDGPSRSGTPRPIFIVGCPRSGTTLLRLILDSHPSISAGPESRFLWGIRAIEEAQLAHAGGLGLDRAEWHDNVRSLFEAFHLRYAEHQGKIRWADKSPDYALMLDYIDVLYPESQIVHIVRDPRDVIDAWRRFYGFKSVRRSAHAGSAMSAQRTNSAPHILRTGSWSFATRTWCATRSRPSASS